MVELAPLLRSYLLLFNIQKAKNAGTLIRSAAAFGVSEVFLVDAPNPKLVKRKRLTFGSHGTEDLTTYRTFESLTAVREYCVSNKITVCGVEITPTSQPVHKAPFKGSTLFVMGNEGTGLNKNQVAICDQFVYIEQYTGKTASLNVAVAGSIILHQFAVWAGFKPWNVVGEKFDAVELNSKGAVPEFVKKAAEEEKKLPTTEEPAAAPKKKETPRTEVAGISDIFKAEGA